MIFQSADSSLVPVSSLTFSTKVLGADRINITNKMGNPSFHLVGPTGPVHDMIEQEKHFIILWSLKTFRHFKFVTVINCVYLFVCLG